MYKNALLKMIMERASGAGDEDEEYDENCTWKNECDGIFSCLINEKKVIITKFYKKNNVLNYNKRVKKGIQQVTNCIKKPMLDTKNKQENDEK